MNTRFTRQLFIIILMFLSLVALPITPARADLVQSPGTDILTQWVPDGPAYHTIQYNIYASRAGEFLDLQAQHIDLTDTPLNKGSVPTFCPQGTSYWCTPPEAAYDIFGIDFNMANSFWGVPFGGSTQNVAAGIQIRQGIAQLLDKGAFVASGLGPAGQMVDCFAPPLQGVPCSQSVANGNIPAWNVCVWDSLHTTPTTGANNCASAFNYASIEGHNGNSDSSCCTYAAGSANFCGAADHFIAAGLASSKDSNCVLKGLSSAAQTQTIALWGPYGSRNGLPLNTLGYALVSAIDNLMGRTPGEFTGVDQFGTPGAAIDCPSNTPGQDAVVLGADAHAGDIFSPGGSLKDILQGYFKASSNAAQACASTWHMAAVGWDLDSGFDQFYNVYNSKFAFNGYSDASFDHWSSMLEFNSTLTGAQQSAQAAEYIMGGAAANIPVWSDRSQYAYLKGWIGVADQTGVGPSNYWTALSTWNPNSGGVLRWGLSQPTLSLNPFHSTTRSEHLVLDEIYDSLLGLSPYVPTSGAQAFGYMANSYALVSNGGTLGTGTDANCPAAIGVSPVQACVKINLRGDISFQDGVQVTASDVKFSFENIMPIALVDVTYDPKVLPTTLGGTEAPGQTENLYIAFSQVGLFDIIKIANVPILPQHIWKTIGAAGPCKDTSISAPGTGKGTAQCSVDSSFLSGPSSDPVSNNMLIGSGPFECVSLFGVVGGGCTTSGSSFESSGNGAITLTRFGSGLSPQGATGSGASSVYFRTNADYKQFLWAAQGSHTPGGVDGFALAADLACPTTVTPNFCSAYNSPDAVVTCISSAGACNGSAAGGANLANPTHSDFVGYASQISRWGSTFWSSPVAYGALDGAIPAPVTLYEDGSQYT